MPTCGAGVFWARASSSAEDVIGARVLSTDLALCGQNAIANSASTGRDSALRYMRLKPFCWRIH
jgi:hypothetical protein